MQFIKRSPGASAITAEKLIVPDTALLASGRFQDVNAKGTFVCIATSHHVSPHGYSPVCSHTGKALLTPGTSCPGGL